MSSPERLELDIAELEQIIVRAALEPADQEKLRAVIETLAFLTRELQNKKTSIHRLRKLIFGASTETLDKIFRKKKPAAEQPESAPADQDGASRNASSQPNDKRKRKGHGRNAAASYEGAQSVSVTHESLQPSQPCSECERGKLYKFKTKPLVRLKGQPLVGGSLYDLQSLRCNLCGKIFTATAPAQAGADKYDASAGAMIAFAKYGNGVPFNRLAKMQAAMGVPLPATTQWDLVHALAKSVAPVHEELIRQAAQGQLLHNDDTPMRGSP
jgi:transposase